MKHKTATRKSVMAAATLMLLLLIVITTLVLAAPLEAENDDWNVNRNPGTKDPSQYKGEWPGHKYFASPDDWRKVPLYQLVTDVRFKKSVFF